jgi:hypothetical protein
MDGSHPGRPHATRNLDFLRKKLSLGRVLICEENWPAFRHRCISLIANPAHPVSRGKNIIWGRGKLQARLHASNLISSRGGCSDDGAGRVCGGASRPSARPCPRRSADGRGHDVGRADRRSVRPRGARGRRCSCRTPRRFRSTPPGGGRHDARKLPAEGGKRGRFSCVDSGQE